MKWYYKAAVPIIWFTSTLLLHNTLSEDVTMERHKFRAKREISIYKEMKKRLEFDSNKDNSLDTNELRRLVRKDLGYDL